METRQPGETTVVAVPSSTIAGPSNETPDTSSARSWIAVGVGVPSKTTARVRAASRGADGDELDGCARIRVAVAELVRLVETAGHLRDEALAPRRVEAVDGNRQRVLLRDVADVEQVLDTTGIGGDALGLERLAALRLDGGEQVGELAEVGLVGGAEERTAEVAPKLRLEHPPGRERAGVPRHDHVGDAELLREEHGVHGACAAEGDQREVARLDPLLDGERADRLRHLRIDDRDDPLGQLLDAQAELLPQPGDG